MIIVIVILITRKGVTPVEWCNCNQYEIGLKPRRVPVPSIKIYITIIITIIIITTATIIIISILPMFLSVFII